MLDGNRGVMAFAANGRSQSAIGLAILALKR
jgi:hypothetical protein